MDRKRGYYIHFDGIKTSGVAKKIQMQIHEFQKISTIEEILVRRCSQKFISADCWFVSAGINKQKVR